VALKPLKYSLSLNLRQFRKTKPNKKPSDTFIFAGFVPSISGEPCAMDLFGKQEQY
jgi:hypothetical protein